MASISSRFLIELASAMGAGGTEDPTDEGYDLMMALASEVVNKGFLSDAIHVGLAHATLSILPSGRLGISRESDRYTQAIQDLMNSTASATIDEALQSHSRSDGIASETDPFAIAEQLAIEEFGFTYTDLSLFTSELVNMARELDQDDVGALEMAAVRERMASNFGWNPSAIDNYIDQLSLGPVDDFWSLGADVRPWRFNRTRSYLRRPLIRCQLEGAECVMFGYRSVIRTSYELHGQYLSGRLKAKSAAMLEALGRARDKKGDDFERDVVVDLKQYCEPVMPRVLKIGNHDLRDVKGVNIGDIDALAFHGPSRTLWVIEAKSFIAARTPSELQNELSDLLEGPHSAVKRLRGRYEWVLANRDEVLDALDIDPAGVIVRPLIVLDTDLLTSRFDTPYDVVTSLRLRNHVEQAAHTSTSS